MHGTGRELMKMDMSALPYKVREWLKKNPRQRHFSVQGDVVFFAPGAVYPILPLWVDDGEGEGCDGMFSISQSGALVVVGGMVRGCLNGGC